MSNNIGSQAVTVSYFDNDNIKTKTKPDLKGDSQYSYTKAGPHAVTQIGSRTFAYDANGNATEDKQGTKVKHFVYTAKDQVQKIDVTVSGTRQHTSAFYYGVGGRFKRVDTDQSNKVTTTLYIGNVEKITHHDGAVQYKRALAGVSQVLYSAAANGALGKATYKFLHKDHLGSITAITNNAGVIEQRIAFDPWGARRKLNNPTSNSASWTLSAMQPSSVLAAFAKTNKNVATNRGFTGHEMLDEVGIIHMNGRIYDAGIGRFLQADPHIDGAGSVGGFNRYAYLKNNPLNGTDPTGYFSLKKELKNGWNKVRPLVGAIVGITLAIWMPWDGGFGAMVAYGAIAGGAGAAANGGNLSDVIRGAAIGGASAAAFFGVAKAIPSAASAAEAGKNAFRIGKNAWMTAGNFANLVVAQGMVGGVMSVLQGGKFGHGFASAGISKLATPGILAMDNVVAESLASGIVGGTVSEATGGKFANGATTAAFLYAFNAGSTAIKDAQEGGYTGTWLGSKDRANVKGLSSKIHVDANGKISVDPLTVSYEGMSRETAQSYIDVAESGWESISLDLTLTSSRGDVHIVPCSSVCSVNPVDGGYLGGAGLGGRLIYYGASQYTDTPVHEFGHIFGLNHLSSHLGHTGSIMGSRPRAVNGDDLIRLRALYE